MPLALVNLDSQVFNMRSKGQFGVNYTGGHFSKKISVVFVKIIGFG